MKLGNLTEKTIIALFIVIFGMCAIVLLELKDTTENSIVNLIIMVVSFYFGSSAVKEQKEKWLNVSAYAEDDLGGSNPPPNPKDK